MSVYPDPLLSRAVVIGVSEFDHVDQLPGLPAVRNNLTDLRSVLTDPVTGIFNDDHCHMIREPRTQLDLVGPLGQLARQAEDLLLVYYAGHGVLHRTKDELFLAVRDTNVDVLSVTAVGFEHIREAMADSRARTKLLILDCCYSGMAIGAMSPATLRRQEIRVEGTSVIASSPKNSISFAPPGARHTAFSAELIRLLRKGPNIGGAPLTVRALFDGLWSAMANQGMPEPQLSAGNTSGELLLRRTPPPKIELRLPRHSIPKPKSLKAPAAVARQFVANPVPPIQVPEGPRAELPPEPRTEPPTVPAFRPVARAGPAAPRKFSKAGSVLLWLVFLLCANLSVGGLLGLIFDVSPDGRHSPDDLATGIVGLIFAVPLGVLIHVRSRKRDRIGRARKRSVIVTPVLIVVFLFCLGMAVAVIATWGGSPGASAPSDGSIDASGPSLVLLLSFAEGVLVSGNALLTAYRPVRPGQQAR